MHLKPEELVDIAEGTRDEEEFASHLAACDGCRRHLSDLRLTIASIGDAPVPEPSPLYWNHFQQRVAAAIVSETAPRRSPWFWWPAAAGLAVAALMVATSTGTRNVLPPRPNGPANIATRTTAGALDGTGFARIELLNDSSADDDPSLQLVADLTATVEDSGFVVEGSAEYAVTHLSGEELRELQRLLEAALKRAGA